MKRSHKKLYVEFVGPHGAGKTVTCKYIHKQNLLKPYTTLYPTTAQRHKVHFLLCCPFIALKNIKHIIFVIIFFIQNGKISRINFKTLRSLLKMIILHPYYYRFNFDVYLKDDMLHMLPRIIFKEKTNIESALKKFLMYFIYLYDGFVYVDIDEKIMHERFKKRLYGEKANLKNSKLILHNRVRKQSSILKKVITSQVYTPHIIIDGKREIYKNAQKVAKFINEIVIKG